MVALMVALAAGTMQAHVEGLATLPFQIANAARAAVTASDLARAGFPGPKDPLEGQFGYFRLFDRGDLSRYTRALGKVWRISEVSVKPYPSGRASHALIGAILNPGMRADEIEALEMFLSDVYGPGEVLADGIVPRHLVTTSTHFHRQAWGMQPPNGVRIHISGIDLIRDEAGRFRVLEDNLRNPSGVSYVLQNRRTLAHVLPEVFAGVFTGV